MSMTTAQAIIFSTFALIALGLAIAMFALRQRMLCYPAMIFWFILCGFAYSQVTEANVWKDMMYYMFWGSIAMGLLSFFAQFAVRSEKDDSKATDEVEYPDEAANPDKETYYDEQPNGEFFDEAVDEDGIIKDEHIGRDSMTSRRRQELRRRQQNRGTRVHTN